MDIGDLADPIRLFLYRISEAGRLRFLFCRDFNLGGGEGERLALCVHPVGKCGIGRVARVGPTAPKNNLRPDEEYGRANQRTKSDLRKSSGFILMQLFSQTC